MKRLLLMFLLAGLTYAQSLTGLAPSATYKDMLHVWNTNLGVDGTLRPIYDGAGNASALQISTTAVKFPSPFTLGATSVTATGAELNTLAGSGFTSGYVPYFNGTKLTNSGMYYNPITGFSGFGTTSPLNKLEVSGGGLRIMGASVAAASGAGVETSYSNGVGIQQAYDWGGSAWLPMTIRGSYASLFSNGNEVLRATSGNVGIGTTNPLAKLDVYGTSNIGQSLSIGQGVSNNWIGLGFNRNVPTGAIFDSSRYAFQFTRTTGDLLQLEVYNGSGTPITNNALAINSAGNVGIGTTTFGTSAAGVLGLGNGTAPTSSPPDMVQLWSADSAGVPGKASLYVRDEAGNVTLLSPHPEKFLNKLQNDSDGLAWAYSSYNPYIGKRITVDMYGFIRDYEQRFGVKFITIEDLPANQVEDWYANQDSIYNQREKQIADWNKRKLEADKKLAEYNSLSDSEKVKKEKPQEFAEKEPKVYVKKDAPAYMKPYLKIKK